MNITLVNSWRVVNAKGGAEKVFCDMANALSRRGHKVTAVCYDSVDGRPGFPLDDDVRLINAGLVPAPLYLLKAIKKVRAFSFTQADRRKKRIAIKAQELQYKLGMALKDDIADVIVSFQIETTFALRNILGKQVPVVTMLHGKPEGYFTSDVSKEVRAAVESSDIIQVLRPEFIEDVLSLLPKAKVVVIPNAVPQFLASRKAKTSTVINVGRISPEKRQMLLVEAFLLVKDKFPNWKLELWGERCYAPKYSRRIEDFIREKKIEDRVLLCGPTNNVPMQLQRASVFVFPSEHEGWGLALTEAMSMGLPVIGCRECSAVNTLISDGINGYLCDSTAEGLAEAMTQLMCNENTRRVFGDNARDSMKAYAPKCIWDQWEALLFSLVKK